MQAAGLALVRRGRDGRDRVLLVRHAERGTWEFPGGGVEKGETFGQAAAREAEEEVGAPPIEPRVPLTRATVGKTDYVVYRAIAPDRWRPKLDGELSDWMWASPNAGLRPEPLHEGMARTLDLLASLTTPAMDADPAGYEHWWEATDPEVELPHPSPLEEVLRHGRALPPGIDAEFKESEHPRGQPGNKGQFGPGGGGPGKPARGARGQGATPAPARGAKAATERPTPAEAGTPAGTPKLTKTATRAFAGKPIPTKTQLSKQESGKIGEAVILGWLRQHGGIKDAAPLNAHISNYAVDAAGDHQAIEFKTGLVSNGESAQKWRATIGQPGKAETAWLATATPEEKAIWNARKMQAIMDRKMAAVADLEKKHGVKIKPRTVTAIINPDTGTADIYSFEGFHHHIRWNSAETKAAYVGSYRYQMGGGDAAMDAEFQETDHPRDESGKFTAGAGGPSLPDSASTMAKAIHKLMNDPSVSTKTKIAMIKTKKPKPGGVTEKFQKDVLKHLAMPEPQKVQEPEEELYVEPEEEEVYEPEKQGSPPPKQKMEPPPHPPGGEKVDPVDKKTMDDIAQGDGDLKDKLDDLNWWFENGSGQAANYANAWMDKLSGKTAPEEKPKAEIPQPHEGSVPQNDLYNIATGSLSDAEKIKKISKYGTVVEYPNGYAAKYADSLIKALGGEGLKQAEAKPTQPEAPKGTIETKNPARLERGMTLWKSAVKVTSAADDASVKAIPTLRPSYWTTKLGKTAKSAAADYKAGSGSINSHLRGEGTDESWIQPTIDKLDEAFEHPEAKITEDIVLHRGENVPDEQLTKWKKQLAAGSIVRTAREGFTSTSAAAKAAFDHLPVQYVITARKGTPALGVYSANNKYEHENEVLLRHGSVFEIYKIEEKGGKNFVHCYTM